MRSRNPGRRALLQAHEERRADARSLLRAGRWAGATYMGGYVVECLLKAAVLARRGLKRLPEEFRHHDLRALASRAGLWSDPGAADARGAREDLNLIVRIWDVTMRYEGRKGDPEEARALMESVEEFRRWLLSRI